MTATSTPSSESGIANKLLEHVIRTPGRIPSPQPAHLSLNSSNGHRVLRSATVGYIAPPFEGKEAQINEVKRLITEGSWIPADHIDAQVEWFYKDLGIDDVYFQTETPEAIKSHITSLYAAKVAASAREDKRQEIRLDMEATDHAIYIDTSEPGISNTGGPRYEQRLEAKYLDGGDKNRRFRVETFRSPAKIHPSSAATMRCYFVYQCQFVDSNPDPLDTRLHVIGDRGFLAKATKNTMQIYQNIIEMAVARTGPVIEAFDIEASQEKRLVVAFRQRRAMGLFCALSDLYHYYGVTSSRKYVEQFSNGITVISIYLKPTASALEPGSKYPPIDTSIRHIVREISLLYCIPQNKFQNMFAVGRLSLQETIYGHCVWVFVQHFLNRLGSEYASLVSALDSTNGAHAEVLSNIKRRLRTETFTAAYILEIIGQYPDLVRSLYSSFADTHFHTGLANEESIPTTPADLLGDEALEDLISRTVNNEHEQLVMDAFRTFNKSVLKTNFFTPTKVALSFRMDPSFLPAIEYPQPLYGMFLVISSEARGFHLRFRDISRGGIRIVKSRNREAFSINARRMFDENYGLANTQQRKNKDIPEGGSKGVILLDPQQQDKGSVAFEKYIDSIMDLLLPPVSPGIKDPIVDLYGKQEILFMGPDENTAELSFFTGKSPKLGGIPHDHYGMTTLSVREYVTGIYRKLNLDPSTVRKMQTGGPDGDLGSNEILLSNEKYTSIVDGAGVLVDPNGINHAELLRLAKKRVMISEFDITKLSKDGYRILLDETDVTLPSGEVIPNGMTFRNTLYRRHPDLSDIFVPCGARPESIDLVSCNKLIQDGKSLIPYIVEGANLFIAQDAKLRLEAAGCILYKDASANKGGVTSSSLEVLASLSFDDEGFLKHMCVQEVIKRNARLEFEAIWRENAETGVARSVLSDTLSIAITKLDEELQNTELWHNEPLRRSVLKDALPKLLLDKIGLDAIIERVPDNYLRSIFGSYLASRFVYEFGTSTSQFAFFDFMSKRLAKLEAY
ncbi:NAD-specific glutamate dehydrogenase [Pseudogymnoascus sp. 24MN13]|nr:NAD-specific glutamate dehydrogenase [Pseudogymnoascus sp. 24MN13]